MIGNAALVPSVDVETQKYLTLLELSKAIASHRDLSELFHDIACRLRHLFSFRDLAVMLHDGQKNVMRSYFFEGCEQRPIGSARNRLKLRSTIRSMVRCGATSKPMIIRDLDQDHRFPVGANPARQEHKVRLLPAVEHCSSKSRNVEFME